jgi:hypothetical protein
LRKVEVLTDHRLFDGSALASQPSYARGGRRRRLVSSVWPPP